MSKGNIGVTSNNIFPVIKKFLYSDHEIFLRELISNAVDATQKLKTLSSVGEVKGDLGDLRVRVLLDKDKKTLTVQDHGIGMTAEEVDTIKAQNAEDRITVFPKTADGTPFIYDYQIKGMLKDSCKMLAKAGKAGYAGGKAGRASGAGH